MPEVLVQNELSKFPESSSEEPAKVHWEGVSIGDFLAVFQRVGCPEETRVKNLQRRVFSKRFPAESSVESPIRISTTFQSDGFLNQMSDLTVLVVWIQLAALSDNKEDDKKISLQLNGNSVNC